MNMIKPVSAPLLSLNPLNICPHPYISVKNAIALSIISWPCHCRQEHDLLDVIFVFTFPMRGFLSMTQIHILRLSRAVEPFLIYMYNVKTSLKGGIVLEATWLNMPKAIFHT
jgi:hypothetical protein